MKIEYGLTDAVYGFIFMTDAARQRCSKGSAAQSCSRAAAAVQGTFPGRHRVGARVFDILSASPSLHPTCVATETANPGERRQARVYGKTATQLDSTRTALCTRQEAACERGGRAGVARAGATRARAWVSRNQLGHTLCAGIGAGVYAGRREAIRSGLAWCRTRMEGGMSQRTFSLIAGVVFGL